MTYPVSSINFSDKDLRSIYNNGSLISNVIEKRLIDQVEADESTIHKVARRGLQCFAVLGGFGARIPFTRIPLAYANGNLIYGIPLAVGSAVSFGALVSWCLLKIIDTELIPQFNEEKTIDRLRLSCFKKTVIKTGVFVVGMLSQAPIAYMAYVYNDKNIYYPIAAVIIDSSFPIYSLSLSVEELLEKKRLGDFEKKLFLLKQKITLTLTEVSEETDLSIWQDRIETINSLALLPSVDRVNRLVSKLFNTIHQEIRKEHLLAKSGRWITMGTGFILSLSQLFMFAVLGYNGMKLFTDEASLWYTAAVVVVLANLYLNMKMTIDGSVQGYNMSIKLCVGAFKISRQTKNYPILQRVLYIVSYILCILSFAGPVKVSQDFFSGWESLYMQIATSIGTIVLSSLACMNLVDEMIEMGMAKNGTDEIKKIMKIVYEIRHIIGLINKSSFLEFAKFTKEISNNRINEWLNELKITTDQIDVYIEKELSKKNEKQPLIG